MTYSRLDFEAEPICRHCDDMLFIRDACGQIVPCPSCCCHHCGRPKHLHPDDNGCECSPLPPRQIIARGPVIRLTTLREE